LVIVVFFLTWGIDALEAAVQREPRQMLAVLGAKLMLFVLAPLGLFCGIWKYKIRDLITASPARNYLRIAIWMSLVLIAFEIAFGRGLSEIRHSGLPLWAIAAGIPLAYLWLLLEVGLVEEFFFRALLQARLAALLRSETAGILLMALLFGLAHAPGLHYRAAATLEGLGPSPSWSVAIAYSIAIISVTGIFLGVLWARTRNILLLMLVHAAGDLVPNLVRFIKA
jgi:uncharacterized protein